jgi:hypothetical protein
MMSFRSTVVSTCSVAGLLGAAVLALGCGDKEPEFPENPQPSASAPPTPPPSNTVATPPPVAACDPVQSVAFSSILQERAKTEAPKMELEGGVVCGTIGTEGGTVDGPTFFMQPGMCYTVLANGLPNVTEVDVQIVGDAAAAGVPPALAQLLSAPLAVDSDTGAMAAIGAKNNCYKWAWPIPAAAKLVVKARTGTGPVGAQVYRKKQ